MRFSIFAGLLMLVGCGELSSVLDSVTLTKSELQTVADNYEGAIVAFKELEYFAVQVAAGDVDLEGAQFTAPTEENGWVGRIQFISDQFPGGDGDLDVTFSLDGPDGPMDPFLVDTTTQSDVTTSIHILFTGITGEGANLDLDADFTLRLDSTDPEAPVAVLNGTFRINHNEHVANLRAEDLAFVEDPASGAATSGSGAIRGTLEIPGYAFDADVDVVVDGDRLSILVEVLDQTIEDADMSIEEFFGTAPTAAATP